MTDFRVSTAPLHVALLDIGEALRTLSVVMTQGINEGNADKRGTLAISLRAAAHRVQHGTLIGFMEDKPTTDEKQVKLEAEAMALIFAVRNGLKANKRYYDPDGQLLTTELQIIGCLVSRGQVQIVQGEEELPEIIQTKLLTPKEALARLREGANGGDQADSVAEAFGTSEGQSASGTGANETPRGDA